MVKNQIMNKELSLTIFSAVVATAVVLGIVRWIAPGLLGIPSDLQLVQLDDKVPPFYENIFRREDLKSTDFIIKDPLTRVRAKPFYPDTTAMGPNDMLGFRNREIRNVVDIVVIGDSQTYGNNASIENNWPGHMKTALRHKNVSVYNMSVGGWGAVQYLDMFANATVFQPRAVVVAFYSGNDALESFQMAYGATTWGGLKPDQTLTQADAPKVKFPSPPEEWWKIRFNDGVETIFTPSLRLSSNLANDAVKAGYDIMADVARRIAKMAKPLNVKVLFTIVPTKELVYSNKVYRENISPTKEYQTLVERESNNIGTLVSAIKSIPDTEYIDVVAPLQRAALGATILYPSDTNGHPLSAGYEVIGTTVARYVAKHIPNQPRGLVAQMVDKRKYSLFLVNDEGVWSFKSQDMIEANGWEPGNVSMIKPRDIVGLAHMGFVEGVDQDRFGPKMISRQ
jgi:lysophospholipase L1-like esterase